MGTSISEDIIGSDWTDPSRHNGKHNGKHNETRVQIFEAIIALLALRTIILNLNCGVMCSSFVF